MAKKKPIRFYEPWRVPDFQPAADYQWIPSDLTEEQRAKLIRDSTLRNVSIWCGPTENKVAGDLVAFTSLAQPEEGTARARRIVECVNAFRGVDDPARFMADVRDLVSYLEQGEYPEEIVNGLAKLFRSC